MTGRRQPTYRQEAGRQEDRQTDRQTSWHIGRGILTGETDREVEEKERDPDTWPETERMGKRRQKTGGLGDGGEGTRKLILSGLA